MSSAFHSAQQSVHLDVMWQMGSMTICPLEITPQTTTPPCQLPPQTTTPPVPTTPWTTTPPDNYPHANYPLDN